jgi:hypothetical protein
MELCQIGNKRLKVQHKQIRHKDHDRDSPDEHFIGSEIGFEQNQFSTQTNLAGANANPKFWLDSAADVAGCDESEVTVNEPNHSQKLEFPPLTSDAPEEPSPLATLTQIQNALPDIQGNIMKEKL